MLAVINHVVDDNIIYVSAAQLTHAPVHGEFNICCTKLPTSFLLSYGPPRPQLNSINYKI